MGSKRLPAWMTDDSNVLKSNNSENTSPKKVPDWMTNDSLVDLNSERTLRSKTKLLRQSGVNEEANAKTVKNEPLPFIEYNGKIHYYIEDYVMRSVCFELLEWVENNPNKVIPVAFDMEWPFSFKTGSGKAALIQICKDINECHLFQISCLTSIPKPLVTFLSHERVCLHGVNIKNDFRKLNRDFPDVNVDKMIEQCVDLGVWCKNIYRSSGRYSMARLVEQICRLQINKDRKVRMSQWSAVPLNEDQKLYAAIDVYISQVIYGKLLEEEVKVNNKLRELEEIYDKKTLAVINRLA